MKRSIYFIVFLLSIAMHPQNDPGDPNIQKKHNEEKSALQFSILNANIKDGDSLRLVLKNTSQKKYYIIYDKAKPINHFTSNRVFISEIYLMDDKNANFILQLKDDAGNNSGGKSIKQTNTTEILEIEPQQIIDFKIPFNMRTLVDKDSYEFHLNKAQTKEQYFVQFTYKFYDDYLESMLCKNTALKQKEKGYELYEKEISSNKVPLIMMSP